MITFDNFSQRGVQFSIRGLGSKHCAERNPIYFLISKKIFPIVTLKTTHTMIKIPKRRSPPREGLFN
jgi:hypothetical protein